MFMKPKMVLTETTDIFNPKRVIEDSEYDSGSDVQVVR